MSGGFQVVLHATPDQALTHLDEGRIAGNDVYVLKKISGFRFQMLGISGYYVLLVQPAGAYLLLGLKYISRVHLI